MADGSAKLSGRDYEFQEPTLRRKYTVRRDFQRRISRREWRVSTWRNKRWGSNLQGFLGSRRSSERILFIVIILNREVQVTCQEKNHILFHWIILMSPGQLVQIWRLHKKSEFLIIGMSTRTEICQIRGRFSQHLRHWMELLWQGTTNPGRDWWKFRRHHVQITRFPLLNETLPKKKYTMWVRIGEKPEHLRQKTNSIVLILQGRT